MNCTQAKQISIVDYLQSHGIKPKSRYRKYYWYLSPYRSENNASFVVNLESNTWYDKSENIGGNIIELIMLMSITDIKGALQILSANDIKSFSFDQQVSIEAPGIEIKHLQPIRNAALIQYLNSRKIPVQLARIYLLESYYLTTNSTKQKFSLAFRNDLNGYHLRNAKFKGIASPGYFTSISGRSKDQLNIFEGVYDFLSALVYFKSTKPKFDCLVLNSNVHIEKVLPILKRYSRINAFLDNDPSGTDTLNHIKAAHPQVENFAGRIYPKHKDFNEFLINSKSHFFNIL
jgi:hypothetical protein